MPERKIHCIERSPYQDHDPDDEGRASKRHGDDVIEDAVAALLRARDEEHDGARRDEDVEKDVEEHDDNFHDRDVALVADDENVEIRRQEKDPSEKNRAQARQTANEAGKKSGIDDKEQTEKKDNE